MSAIGLFSLAALALLMIPGPAVLYIVARSSSQGRRAGLVSVMGIHSGTLVHIAAAVLGLSAIIVASATAFNVVKFAGAAYLIYMGVRTMLTRVGPASEHRLTARTDRQLYTDGFVVNALNPKTAVFFLAFVPQFVDANAGGSATTQLLVLSAVFVGLGLVTDSMWALASATIATRLRRRNAKQRREGLITGSLYVGLGLMTAVTGRHTA
ncbi:MAG TPA: LysE family translocator [Ilumatobacter sp.]|nr:LysE family translocator [Ilumatobacter sp.]